MYRIVFGQKKVNKKFAHSQRIENHFFVYKDQSPFFGVFPEIFLPQFLTGRGGKNSIQENKKTLSFFSICRHTVIVEKASSFILCAMLLAVLWYIAYCSVHKGNFQRVYLQNKQTNLSTLDLVF